MSEKDAKVELKCARKEINNKEFKKALQHCQNVLELDKDNYNAYVFIGLCAAELNEYEQSKVSYKKAISIDSKSVLAWQGIVSLYEKTRLDAWDQDHIDALKVMLDFFDSDDNKWCEYCWKLVNICKKKNKFEEACAYLLQMKLKDIGNYLLVDEELLVLFKLQFQAQSPKVKKSFHQLMNQYDTVISGKQTLQIDTSDLCQQQLSYVLSYMHLFVGELDHILGTAKRYTDTYVDNVTLAEMFCKLILLTSCDLEVIFSKYGDDLQKAIALLKPESPTSLYIEAVLACQTDNFRQARDTFMKASPSFSTETIFLLHQSRVDLELHLLSSAVELLTEARKHVNVSTFANTRASVLSAMRLHEVDILLKRKEATDLNSAEAILETILSENRNDTEALLRKVELKIVLGDTELAIQCMDHLDDVVEEAGKVKLLIFKAQLSMMEGKYFDAEVRLLEALEVQASSGKHLLLGQVYWKLAENDVENYPKAYNEFVKAAKLDPYNSDTFLHLGEYAERIMRNTTKATQCYAKSFQLDVHNESAAVKLADLYVQQEMLVEAEGVYKKVISEVTGVSTCWAWKRLALAQMRAVNHGDALVSFQRALYHAPGDAHIWECLGEAYLASGAYSSASKVFQRALLLNEASVMCRYKLCEIQRALGQQREAVSGFTQLLEDYPDHFPSLVGLASSYLSLEVECLRGTFDQTAIDHAQQVLEIASQGLIVQPKSSLLWKVLADACSALHPVADQVCLLRVPAELRTLLALDEKDASFGKRDILQLAVQACTVLVRLNGGLASVWHDLGLSMYRQARFESLDALNAQSIQAVKKAISLDGQNHLYWNTLGVLMGESSDSDSSASHAQHAFIKALQLSPDDASTWCNLGSLYLKHAQLEQAHTAFKKSLSSDPLHAPAWVGQALIAESLGNDDAMDLFRHATELRFHVEGSRGYAHWMCSSLEMLAPMSGKRSTQACSDLSHLPANIHRSLLNSSGASEACCRRYHDDIASLNMLALLLEQQGLLGSAEKQLERARTLLTSSSDVNVKKQLMLRVVLLNQARILRGLKRYTEALEIYKSVGVEKFSEVCALALTSYQSGDLESAMQTYERAQALASNDPERNAIAAAMGCVAYAMNDFNLAKRKLFESTTSGEASEQGLMGLAALGMLSGDGKLALVALAELAKSHLQHKEGATSRDQSSLLLSSFHLLQGDSVGARRQISRLLMRNPDDCALWSRLARLLVTHNSEQLAERCANKADRFGPAFEASVVSALTALVTGGDSKAIRRCTQKLVHSYPHETLSWLLLAMGRFSLAVIGAKPSRQTASLPNAIKSLLQQVEEKLTNSSDKRPGELSFQNKVRSWITKQYILTEVYYGSCDQGRIACEQIIPSLSEQPVAQKEFLFLRGLASMCDHDSLEDRSAIIPQLAAIADSCDGQPQWCWKLLADAYDFLHRPLAAELCQRRVLQSARHSFPVLLLLASSALRGFCGTKQKQWLDRAHDALEQASKVHSSQGVLSCLKANEALNFLKAVLFMHQENKRAAKKYAVLVGEDSAISELCERLLSMLAAD